MLFKTHLAFGFFTALILLPFFNINRYLFFILVLFGALLPDVDNVKSKLGRKIKPISKIINILFGHRGLFHSIYPAILILFLTRYFFNIQYGVALFIGYLSHIIIDGLTIAGVDLLHPLASLKITGFIETGKTSETIVFILILVLIAITMF